MPSPVIHVENLGKRYRIGERQAYEGLRHVLDRALWAPFRMFRPRRPVFPGLWLLVLEVWVA
jgi:hypothetical protein